ncbi:hypothetical protein HKX48_002089, partial [Thoreauomyces humboldtii]
MSEEGSPVVNLEQELAEVRERLETEESLRRLRALQAPEALRLHNWAYTAEAEAASPGTWLHMAHRDTQLVIGTMFARSGRGEEISPVRPRIAWVRQHMPEEDRTEHERVGLQALRHSRYRMWLHIRDRDATMHPAVQSARFLEWPIPAYPIVTDVGVEGYADATRERETPEMPVQEPPLPDPQAPQDPMPVDDVIVMGPLVQPEAVQTLQTWLTGKQHEMRSIGFQMREDVIAPRNAAGQVERWGFQAAGRGAPTRPPMRVRDGRHRTMVQQEPGDRVIVARARDIQQTPAVRDGARRRVGSQSVQGYRAETGYQHGEIPGRGRGRGRGGVGRGRGG